VAQAKSPTAVGLYSYGRRNARGAGTHDGTSRHVHKENLIKLMCVPLVLVFSPCFSRVQILKLICATLRRFSTKRCVASMNQWIVNRCVNRCESLRQ
jgi:hypothetical protein